MRNKSDKLPKCKKIIVAVVISAVVVISAFLCIEKRVRRYTSEMGTYYCRCQLSEVINGSVRSVLEKTGAEYSDLSTEMYDENGNFVSASINTKNTNKLQSMVVSEINGNISGLSDSEIEISAGTLSGIVLLNGKGPDIRLRLVPVGSAQAEMKSSFESAGINQTCHRISLDITAEVKAVYPTGSETVTVSMNCILAENIIAGEVPEGILADIAKRTQDAE